MMMGTMAATASEQPANVVPVELYELYRRHRSELVRLAALLVGDEAEEIVQDAFVKAHPVWERRRDPARSLSYLRSAVLNGARSRLRRRAVAARIPWVPAGNTASAETLALAADEHLPVIAAVRTLPRRQRECVVLRYYLDLPESEIASWLGISQGSVKTHLHRAVSTLASRLEELDR
jgi:RNA polymerase sigma-70 factor (sigma-E family)